MPSSRRHLHPDHIPAVHVSPRVLHWHSGELHSDDHDFQIHGETLLYLLILFSLILLISLLLLYARSFFRLRHLPPSSSAPQFLIHLPRPPPPAGLHSSAIHSIPIILHQLPDPISAGNPANCDSECCICLAAFEYGDKVKLLPSCRHRYHCDCVDAWLREHSNCPLCRLPVAIGSGLPL